MYQLVDPDAFASIEEELFDRNLGLLDAVLTEYDGLTEAEREAIDDSENADVGDLDFLRFEDR